MRSQRKQAAESLSLEQAHARMDWAASWVEVVLRRVDGLLPSGRLRVLEVGAAQGNALIALSRLGHQAHGVEPWREAIEVGHELAREQGVPIDIRPGRAEKLPFADEEFDLVLAFSVLEHVGDLDACLREIHRVLRPHGVFWFSIASSMCPRQMEISGFPLFGWYPNPLKRRIMAWAARSRPHLVGHTDTPAINWWTPRKARRELQRAGFEQIRDRWELRLPSEVQGTRRVLLKLAKRAPVLRILGDVLVPHCSFAARKAPTSSPAARP